MEELARILYTEYCAAVGGKAYNDTDLPTADEFFSAERSKKQADAWRKVAQVAWQHLAR